jgi:hypothetical protein
MQIALSQGFYQAKSLISDAQRSLNLYPEKNPSDSPFPYTAYLTPGLTLLAAAGANGCRCLYTAGNGDLYGCYANTVYYISPSWVFTALGTVGGSGLVSMSDNLLVVAVVDGTGNGWYIDMATRAMTAIVDPAFYGADIVDYLDTFMVFNRPRTNQWYISPSEWTGNSTSGPVTGGTVSGGSGYSNGTFGSVPLTGGTGTGAVAAVMVAGGAVTGVAIGVGGAGYLIGDVLSATPASLGGGVTGGNITAGSLYTNGTYTNVPLTGGSGSGALATVIVSTAHVTTVTITTPGIGYVVGDVLSALPSQIGGTGSGFLYTLTSVNVGGSGFTYTVSSIGPGNDSFDPLAIASITGASDELQTLKVMHRELWLLGVRKASEVWYDSGAADFPFQALPGVFVEHGCVAKYSIAKADLSIFWVGQDKEGDLVVFEGTQYQAKRISTFAIENAIQQYPTVTDAVGFTYQQEGHVFYQLTFPSADKTWVYDVATQLWHERAWLDDNGIEHRHRAIQAAFAYGVNVVGDWQNGNLYQYDPANFTDNGQPISRIRDFPHILNSGKRLCVNQVIAAMATGIAPGTSTLTSPLVGLSSSTDGGNVFGNTVQTTPIGSAGQYSTQPQWRQLGLGRDWVFRLTWSSNYFTACMGLWLEATPAQT